MGKAVYPTDTRIDSLVADVVRKWRACVQVIAEKILLSYKDLYLLLLYNVYPKLMFSVQTVPVVP